MLMPLEIQALGPLTSATGPAPGSGPL